MISARLRLSDYHRIIRAFTRVLKSKDREKHQLPRRCAVDYRNLLSRNIMTQKFASTYPPYNTRYAAWKAQYFASTGFHVMRGTMVSNLSVYRGRYKTHWYSGLPSGLTVPGSSWFGPPGKGKPKSVNMYAFVNEYGGNFNGYYHPARPVWRPTLRDYEREGFRQRGKQSLRAIGRNWR